jgi:hypothetical protein
MATSAPTPVVIGGKKYPAGTVVNQSTGHIMQPTGLLDDNQQPEYTDLTGSEYNRTHPGAGGIFGGFVDSVKGLPQGLQGLSPVLSPAAMLIPGLAPILAGLNAAGSLANGKVNIGTVLSALTAANGLGVQVPGVDPSMLKTIQQGASAVNAVKTGNVAGMLNSLLQVSGTANQDTNTAIQMINAATALKKNDMAGAMSALSGLTGSPDLKVASTAANILQSINPSATPQVGFGKTVEPAETPQLGFGQSNTPAAPATQPASTPAAQAMQAPQNVLVAAPVVGNMVALDQFGVKNPFLSSREKQVVTDTGYAHGGSVEDLLRILRS